MLDEKDHLILAALKRDASRPVRALEHEVGLPRSTIQNRITKMLRSGVIRKIVAIPDYEKIGLPVTAIILVSFNPSANTTQRELAKRIAQIDNVFEVYVVAGTWDLVLKARGSSLREIGELVVDRLRLIPGVAQTVTCGCFFTIKEEP